MFQLLLDAEIIFEMLDELHNRIKDVLGDKRPPLPGPYLARLYKLDGMYHTLEYEVMNAERYVLTEEGVQALSSPTEGRPRQDRSFDSRHRQ